MNTVRNHQAPKAGSPESSLVGNGSSAPAVDAFQLKTFEAIPAFDGESSVEGSRSSQPQTAGASAVAFSVPIQRKANNTGLPDNLKNGVEHLSGFALDDVKVHYNSPAPAALQAHAYAQGTDIHIAPGQEKHLPHEAWHVAQQKQGRVQPTRQLKEKVAVNDDTGLENEADVMGQKALDVPFSVEQFATPMQQVPAGNAVQLKKVDPTLGDGTAIGFTQMSPVNDDQAPVNIAEYSYTSPATEADRNKALLQIQNLYGEIGAGLQDDPKFMSRNTFKTFAYSDAANAPYVYDILHRAGKLADPKPATNQLKQTAFRAVLGKSIKRADLSMFLDKDEINLKDPLLVIINVPYTGGTLSATVNFTEAYRGYVTGIREVATGGGPDLINATLERRDPYTSDGNTGTTRIDTFSATHHLSNTKAQADIDKSQAGNTHFEQEKGVDTMTKIIAEGGRFNCVKERGTDIKNSTRFYAKIPAYGSQEELNPYVTFGGLYRLWTDAFGAKYNIPNDAVADYLLENAETLPSMTAIQVENASDAHRMDEA